MICVTNCDPLSQPKEGQKYQCYSYHHQLEPFLMLTIDWEEHTDCQQYTELSPFVTTGLFDHVLPSLAKTHLCMHTFVEMEASTEWQHPLQYTWVRCLLISPTAASPIATDPPLATPSYHVANWIGKPVPPRHNPPHQKLITSIPASAKLIMLQCPDQTNLGFKNTWPVLIYQSPPHTKLYHC